MNSKHVTRNWQLTVRNLQGLLLFLILLISNAAWGQEFTARSIGDFGNVAVMEVTGNYDANNPDGSINSIPRQGIFLNSSTKT
jgi:hypothetical protein